MGHLSYKSIGIALVALCCVGLASCTGTRGPKKKVCYPVTGQLTVSGKPAAGATVILRPRENADTPEWAIGFPHANVKEDGSFEVGTYTDNDGAPAGGYLVLVTWNINESQNEEAPSKDRLNGKYADPSTSKLTAKVDAGPTQLPPIQLP
jgi:hypothetical protein